MINHSVLQTLPKAQRSQGIEYFDSFNTFSSSKQNLRQAFKSRSNFSFVMVGKGGGIYKTTLTNPHINFDKSMLKLLEIHVLILTNPCENFHSSFLENVFHLWRLCVRMRNAKQSKIHYFSLLKISRNNEWPGTENLHVLLNRFHWYGAAWLFYFINLQCLMSVHVDDIKGIASKAVAQSLFAHPFVRFKRNE